MPPSPKKLSPFHDPQSLGVRGARGRPTRMPRAHVHTDIEINFVFRGSMQYFFADRFATVPRGRFTIFWAGAPHRLMKTAPLTEMAWITIPLAWFMQWETDRPFLQRLLRTEMISNPSTDPADVTIDSLLVDRWVRDLEMPTSAGAKIALAEIESRIGRLAIANRAKPPRAKEEIDPLPTQLMLRFVGQKYREPLSVAEIAAEVNLHPNYAMQLFKRSCGMGLWEYLTRMRISHAQRLLLTTDWKISRIAMESGFNSAGRFYENFAKIAGQSPHVYRKSIGKN